MSLADRRERLEAAVYAKFGEAATWTPTGGGAPLPVTIRRREEQDTARFGGPEALILANVVRVRRSEVAAPAAGDLVAIAGDTFKVIAEPQLLARGRQWLCEVAQVFDA